MREKIIKKTVSVLLIVFCCSAWFAAGNYYNMSKPPKIKYILDTIIQPVDTLNIIYTQLRNQLKYRETGFNDSIGYRMKGMQNGIPYYGRYMCSQNWINQFCKGEYFKGDGNLNLFIQCEACQEMALIGSFNFYLKEYKPSKDWILTYLYLCHSVGFYGTKQIFEANKHLIK